MKNSIILSILFSLLIVQGAIAGKLEQNVKAFYTALDAGNFDQAASYLAADVKAYLPFSPEPFNKEAYKMLGVGFKTGFPDIQHKILETKTTENKDVVAFKGWFSGTNTGSMQGNPPTGNRVQSSFLGYMKFDKSGKIIEVNIQFDLAGFNAQLMKGIPPMSNKATELTNTFFNKIVGGQHDVTLLNDLLASNFTSNAFPVPNANRDQFTAGIKGLLEGFPDIQCFVIQQFSQGNKVFNYAYWEATNTGSFMRMPATGKKVRVEFMDIWTEENGKILRNEVVMDIAGLMAQLSPSTAMKN